MSKSMAEIWLEEGIEKGLERGRAEGRRDASREPVLRIGRRHLGEPSPAQLDRLESISDLAALEQLSERILDAASWEHLLDCPRD